MTLPKARLGAFFLGVWMIVALRLGLTEHAAMAAGFGDSDDATRLVMVRELMHGRGWWDPAILRLQPPAAWSCTGHGCSTACWPVWTASSPQA